MKKALTLVLALVVALSAMSIFSFAADSTAEYANTKPVLDGEIDAAWDVAPAQESEYLGDNNGEGISGYTKLLWDEDYLYFLAVVQDETMLMADAPATTDSIDLWVSETYSADPSGFPEPGDYIITVSPYNTLGGYYIGNEDALGKVEFSAKMVDDKSYIVEVRMPWMTEGFEAKAGVEIGYNVSFNNDLDGDGARDSWVSWQDYNNRPYWSNTGALNTVALTGAKVVTVDEIAAAAGLNPLVGNVDLGSIVSSEGNANEGGENLFDNSTATKFCTGIFPIEVTWAMDGAYSINGIIFATANDNAEYNGRNPETWTLSGSTDGASWTQIASGTEADFGEVNFTYFPVSFAASAAYSQFKLEISGATSGCMQVSEAVLCGTPAAAEAAAEAAPAVEAAPVVTPAAQTSDIVIIAAIVAVVACVGIVIARKRSR